MGNFVVSLVPIVAIVCIFGLPILAVAFVLVKLITSNNKERLELARHGIIPPVHSKPSPNKYISLRNGIMCIGIAIGLVMGMYFASFITDTWNGDVSMEYARQSFHYFNMQFFTICSTTIFCLGLSYIVFYFIVKNKNLDNY
jgi:hypothetical protein